MKYKQFLMLGAVLLVGVTVAQQTEPAPRIQRPEAIAMGNLIEVVQPQYPDEARQQHLIGKVVLKILIDNQGTVKEASLLAGDPLLADATAAAVKQWKFRPYTLNNERVEVETTATVEYTTDPPYVVTPKSLQRPRMIRLSADVMRRYLVRRVNPHYPLAARANHIHGDVLIQADIDEQGNIVKMKVIQGNPMLARAATEAVAQWKYRPFTFDGEPVAVETTIKVQFHM